MRSVEHGGRHLPCGAWLRRDCGNSLLQAIEGRRRAGGKRRSGRRANQIVSELQAVDSVDAPVVGGVVARRLERAHTALHRVPECSHLGPGNGFTMFVEDRAGDDPALRDLQPDGEPLAVFELDRRAGPARSGNPLTVGYVQVPDLGRRQREAAGRKRREGVAALIVRRGRAAAAERLAGKRDPRAASRCAGSRHDDGADDAGGAEGRGFLVLRRHVAPRRTAATGRVAASARPGRILLDPWRARFHGSRCRDQKDEQTAEEADWDETPLHGQLFGQLKRSKG